VPKSEQQVAAETELRQEINEKLRELDRQPVEHLRDFLVERCLARGGLLEIEPSMDSFRPEEPALFPSL
jgi:chromatin segregation and condensation protein Rec8/ScpA/Scc1 (kleisin family)